MQFHCINVAGLDGGEEGGRRSGKQFRRPAATHYISTEMNNKIKQIDNEYIFYLTKLKNCITFTFEDLVIYLILLMYSHPAVLKSASNFLMLPFVACPYIITVLKIIKIVTNCLIIQNLKILSLRMNLLCL